jgi:hypothetical protein
MTRSYVLLHCQIARLVTARTKAWDGRDLGAVHVLLETSRWGRLLKLLELSGVGKVVADGTDEDES